MKDEATEQGSRARSAGNQRAGVSVRQVGLVPGLERLVPGTHDPHLPVRSRFGTFKLPTRFYGSEITLIANGTLFGP